MLYDIVIIGAGICGTMLARELSRYYMKMPDGKGVYLPSPSAAKL